MDDCDMPDARQPRQRNSWFIKHGGSKKSDMHPVYKVWTAMRQRCLNPKNMNYHRYGGRGITVCDRWADFQNFIDDMGERPEGLQLERIDNNQGYEPGNCRWATRSEQVRNRECNRTLEWRGKSQTMVEWAEELGMSSRTLAARLRDGWTVERALSRPVARWLAKGVR